MTKEVHRLEELLVEEVSIVDRPANKRRFLTVKSEEAMQHGKEIVKDENGNLVTEPTATPEVQAPVEEETPLELAETFKAAGEAIEKNLSIDPDMRREIFRSLNENMGRLQTVMMSADVAHGDPSKAEKSKLVPLLAAELDEVGKALMAMGKRMGGVRKADDSDEDVSAEDTDQATLEALVSEIETTIEKRGAKMSKSRLKKFNEAITLLQSILKELSDPADAFQKDNSADAPEVVETAKVDDTQAKLDAIAEQATKLAEVVKAQKKEISELRKATPVSNAIAVEKSEWDAPPADESWPWDMNNEKTRDTIDKSISFYDNEK